MHSDKKSPTFSVGKGDPHAADCDRKSPKGNPLGSRDREITLDGTTSSGIPHRLVRVDRTNATENVSDGRTDTGADTDSRCRSRADSRTAVSIPGGRSRNAHALGCVVDTWFRDRQCTQSAITARTRRRHRQLPVGFQKDQCLDQKSPRPRLESPTPNRVGTQQSPIILTDATRRRRGLAYGGKHWTAGPGPCTAYAAGPRDPPPSSCRYWRATPDPHAVTIDIWN